MCLAVPGKIVDIKGSSAKVDIIGTVKDTNLMLLANARVGDYVIVHAGFAIEFIDEARAKETLKLMDEMT
jgi:hydrogenase expression/formation protein HypC